MRDGIKVLLIGGTSHVGKSTIARSLAAELGWNHLSTDQLARHPGRPWRNDEASLPKDVISHYSRLSTTELVDAVEAHYQQNVWPIIDAVVCSHLNNPYDPCLVFEGSAILPELAAATPFERTSCVWLTASDELITQRIEESSQLKERPDAKRQLIQAFLERTLMFNNRIVESVAELGQQSIDASTPDVFQRLVGACIGGSIPERPVA